MDMPHNSQDFTGSDSSAIVLYQTEDGQTSVRETVWLTQQQMVELFHRDKLKKYLMLGYALNQRRLVENGAAELRGMLDLLATTAEKHQLAHETGLEVMKLVLRYSYG